MTVEAIILLVSTIISIAAELDRGTASALANNRSSELTSKANKLVAAIAEDEALTNKLLSAAQSRDSDLFQSLINSSPFGSRFKQLKQEYVDNKDKINKYQNEAVRIQKEGQEAQKDLNDKQARAQSSGSAIWDLVSGRATTDLSSPEYDRTSDQIKGD